MQTLKITLFSDGRPGHEKQSLGVISALRNYCAIDLNRIMVAQRPLLSDLGAHLSYFLHLDRRSGTDNASDLLIGTGSRTHLPMLRSRRGMAKVVTCMAPMSLLINHFDLCFIPQHDRINSADNIVRTVGPPSVAGPASSQDPTRALILVGGEDHRSHYWDSKRIVADISGLMHDSPALHWTIASSPRTPVATEALLRDLAAGMSRAVFLPFSETAPGWVEEQYHSNAQAWITGDSISMVYEALSAGCRVGIIEMQWKKRDNKFRRSLECLIRDERVITRSQYKEGIGRWKEHSPLNEADRCAREILKRWWPKNLP